MSVFPLSVSLNQLTSITFLPGKLREKKKKRKKRNTYRKNKQNTKNNELSQYQLGARGGGQGIGKVLVRAYTVF